MLFTLISTLTLPVILLALLTPARAAETQSDFVGESDPDVINALKFSGQKRSIKDSLRLLDQAMAKHPERLYLHSWKARLLAEIYESEAAIKEADIVLAREANNVLALGVKARALANLGQPEASLAIFQKALKLKPENSYLLSQRGRLLRGEKRYGEALKDFDRLVKQDEGDSINRSERAYCLMGLGGRANMEKACRDLEIINQMTRLKNYNSISRLGRIYTELGRFDKAEETLKAGIAKHPVIVQLQADLLKVYESSGQTEKARQQKIKLTRIEEELGLR